jgi:hypothetical protein
MIRVLTAGEQALAEEAFAESLTRWTIRFLAVAAPFDRAFVAGAGSGGTGSSGRGGHCRPTSRRAVSAAGDLHPRTDHVWQAQQGVNLLTGQAEGRATGRRPMNIPSAWTAAGPT